MPFNLVIIQDRLRRASALCRGNLPQASTTQCISHARRRNTPRPISPRRPAITPTQSPCAVRASPPKDSGVDPDLHGGTVLVIGRRLAHQPARCRRDAAGEAGVGTGVGDIAVRVGEGHLALVHGLTARPSVLRRGAVLLDVGKFYGACHDRPFHRQRRLPVHKQREQCHRGAESAEGNGRCGIPMLRKPRRDELGDLMQADRRAEHDRKHDRRADPKTAPHALRQVALKHRIVRMARVVIDSDDLADRIFARWFRRPRRFPRSSPMLTRSLRSFCPPPSIRRQCRRSCAPPAPPPGRRRKS